MSVWHEVIVCVQVIVRYTDAILGSVTEVPTIHGQAMLQIPAGTQSGQVLTMRGAGISPGSAGLAAKEGILQIGAGDSQRGAHHFIVIVLLPQQACPVTASRLLGDVLCRLVSLNWARAHFASLCYLLPSRRCIPTASKAMHDLARRVQETSCCRCPGMPGWCSMSVICVQVSNEERMRLMQLRRLWSSDMSQACVVEAD